MTGLDALLAFSKRDLPETAELEHPDLGNIRFIAKIPRDSVEVNKIQEAGARRQKTPMEKMTMIELHRWALAGLVQAIQSRPSDADEWQTVYDSAGDPASFLNGEFQERMKSTHAADCLFKLVKDDGIVSALYRELVSKTSFGTQVDPEDEEDPTKAL